MTNYSISFMCNIIDNYYNNQQECNNILNGEDAYKAIGCPKTVKSTLRHLVLASIIHDLYPNCNTVDINVITNSLFKTLLKDRIFIVKNTKQNLIALLIFI